MLDMFILQPYMLTSTLIRILICTCFILATPLIIKAQETDNVSFYRTSAHYGFIIPHSKKIKDISDSNPWGFEFEAGKILLKENSYKNCNCFSKIGVAFKYYNFDNPYILGESATIALFGEPYLTHSKKSYFTLKAGAGISFTNTTYDSITNPQNLFFSSKIAFYLGIQLSYNFDITNQSTIKAAFAYNHISNGGIKLPNLGMNFPTLMLGYEYRPQELEFPKYLKGKGYKQKKWRYYAITATYRENVSATDTHVAFSKWVYSTEFFTTRSLSNINGLLFSSEALYDGAAKRAGRERGFKWPSWWFSSSFGHILAFGKISFTQQFYYAFMQLPYYENRYYQRYSLYYSFTEHLMFGISLKARAQVAYQMDVRVGWLF